LYARGLQGQNGGARRSSKASWVRCRRASSIPLLRQPDDAAKSIPDLA
jgi:hypothetical protein